MLSVWVLFSVWGCCWNSTGLGVAAKDPGHCARPQGKEIQVRAQSTYVRYHNIDLLSSGWLCSKGSLHHNIFNASLEHNDMVNVISFKLNKRMIFCESDKNSCLFILYYRPKSQWKYHILLLNEMFSIGSNK